MVAVSQLQKGFGSLGTSSSGKAGFFNGFGVYSSVSYWDLSGSPEAHQNFEGSTPELCSGVHQKGCDLEGVEGATPPTQLTHLSTSKQ